MGVDIMLKEDRGFTLIELLVVIAIIAILAAILFPIFAGARLKGQGVSCLSNMRQLGIAHRMYMDDFNESLAPYAFRDEGIRWWQLLGKYSKSQKVLNCPSRKRWSIGMNHPQLGRLIWRSSTWGSRGNIDGYCRLNDISYLMKTVCFADTGLVSNASESDPNNWIEQANGADVDYFRTPDNVGYYEAGNEPHRVVNRHSGTASCCFMDGHAKPVRAGDIGFQYALKDPRAMWDIY